MSYNWFKALLKDAYCFISGKTGRSISALEQDLSNLKRLVNIIKKDEYANFVSNIRFQILYYFGSNPESELYKDEIEYIKGNNDFVFPYHKKESTNKIVAAFDNIKMLPYVVHKNKRLYFPSAFDVETAKNIYQDFIENEGLTGDGLRRKNPHQYESESFFVGKDEVLLDLGCAEALFSLDKVETAKKIYLIESNPLWKESLLASFEPWKDKVVLIDKYITNKVSDYTTTLQEVLKNEGNQKLFIKMDIEGNELDVLKSSLDYLSTMANVKIACCTYHRANDFADISKLLKSYGYKTDVSDGYMVFVHDRSLAYPFFRHGLIRATKE